MCTSHSQRRLPQRNDGVQGQPGGARDDLDRSLSANAISGRWPGFFVKLADRINAAWYRPHLTLGTALLLPASFAYAGMTGLRRLLYRMELLRSTKLSLPVVVVGNIVVGGTGKTPLVIALADALYARGWRPGVVSRGHGGSLTRSTAGTLVVTTYADPRLVGDEPLVMARAGIAVAVGRDRVAAARSLCTAHPDINVIIADDGLQHYALARDFEIAVFDAQRGLGNGRRLPAGPLRESAARLHTVNCVVITHGARDGAGGPSAMFIPAAVRVFVQTLEPGLFRSVNARDVSAAATRFVGRRVHALAGIGHPDRFFATLATLRIDAVTHAFPDHHPFTAADLAFPDAEAILMTEKDAVKCSSFADARCWYLPVRARVDSALIALVENTIRGSQAA